jgi:hypothetical protein
MITVFFFLIIFAGKSAEQVGPFLTLAQCERGRDAIKPITLHMDTYVSECYAGTTLGKP